MSVILEAHDLVKRFPLGDGSVDALRGVSLSVAKGEFVAIMGSSGSGKSTMLHLLGGLDRPSEGSVVIDGIDISQLTDEEATLTRREKTGFVFQFFNLISLLNVAENVGAAVPDRRRFTRRLTASGSMPCWTWWGSPTRPSTDRTSSPRASSSGSRSRGRSPTSRRSCWPMSRPGNLDFVTGTEILDLIWDSCDRLGQTIVLVTHDARAAAYADRVLVVRDGTIRDEIELGRRRDHEARPLITRLAALGL